MHTDTVQGIRITFGVEWPVCFASVLDLGRLWERLLRRAGLPLAYSQGYNPHPRLTFGMALPVGYTSECELADVLLAERLDLEDVRRRVEEQCPPGLRILGAEELPLGAPSPQSTMREAEYVVRLRGSVPGDTLLEAIRTLLERPRIPRQRLRKGRQREYDLRPLIHAATCAIGPDGEPLLHLRLACGADGAGRPEEVVQELCLGVMYSTIRRVRLVWGAAPRGGEGSAL